MFGLQRKNVIYVNYRRPRDSSYQCKRGITAEPTDKELNVESQANSAYKVGDEALHLPVKKAHHIKKNPLCFYTVTEGTESPRN